MHIIEAVDYDLSKIKTWPIVGPLEKTAKLTIDDYIISGGSFPGEINRWKLYCNDGTKGIGNILVGVILTKDDSKDLYLSYNPEYVRHRLIQKNFENKFTYNPEIDDQSKLEGFKTRGGDYLVRPSIEHIASSIEEPVFRDFTKKVKEVKEEPVFASFVVVRFEDGQFAAVQRSDGKVAFPGGKVEEAEKAVDAAIREAHEEGWDVEGIEDEPFFEKNIKGKRILWFKANKAVKIDSTDKSQPMVAQKEQLIQSFNNDEAIHTFEHLYPFVPIAKKKEYNTKPHIDKESLLNDPERQEFIKSIISSPEELKELIKSFPVLSIAYQNGLTEVEIRWLFSEYGVEIPRGRKTISSTESDPTANRNSLMKNGKRISYLLKNFNFDKMYNAIMKFKHKEKNLAEISTEFRLPEHEIRYLMVYHINSIKILKINLANIDKKEKHLLFSTTIKIGNVKYNGYFKYEYKTGVLYADFDEHSDLVYKSLNAISKIEHNKIVDAISNACYRYFK